MIDLLYNESIVFARTNEKDFFLSYSLEAAEKFLKRLFYLLVAAFHPAI